MFNINNEKKIIPEYNVNRLIMTRKNELLTPIQPITKKIDIQVVLPSKLKQTSEYLFEIY